MIKTILGTFGKVLFKIGLAATAEKFMAKVAFDILYWLASLTSNKVDDMRVMDLENIYYGRGDTHAMDTNNHINRKT